MKGVFFSAKLPELCEVRDFPIPQLGDDEILVKNVAVASNPKDWKIPLNSPDWEGIEGSDLAGHVHAVGKNVSEFKKGDRVAAFTKIAEDSRYGAYAEYTVAPAHTSWRLAKSTAFEQAVTLPLTMMTAAIGLFVSLELTPPPESMIAALSKSKVIVINGASSSVGSFAVQLAKKAGYLVVATAGSSADAALRMGADKVVDYRGRSPVELGRAVRQAVESLSSGKETGPIAIYDTVSTEATVEMLAYQVLDYYPDQQGVKITILSTAHAGGEGLHSKTGVQVIPTSVDSAHGDNAEFAKKWYRIVGKWLDEGRFKPNDAKIMPHGLDSVKAGIQLLRENKVNGFKLVYRIADTRSLSSS